MTVDIDIEMAREHNKPRVVIRCNFENLEEAEKLRIEIKKRWNIANE